MRKEAPGVTEGLIEAEVAGEVESGGMRSSEEVEGGKSGKV